MTTTERTTPPTAPPAPSATRRPVAERVRWAFADGTAIAGRNLAYLTRDPGMILASLLYPAVSVLLFGYVFGSAINVQGGGDYREFLMPGLFVQTMAFGVAETMTGVATDSARGVTDRFRSIPMSQAGVVLGRSFSDMASAAIGLAILIVCGLVVGWQWNDGLVPALGAVGLLLLLRFALIWAGIWVGLLAGKPERVQAAWGILFPLTMISSTFVQPEVMPGWLGAIAQWNPITATVDATRELFGNPGLPSHGFAADHAIELAVLWPLLLVAVFLPLSVRQFRRLGR